MISLEIPDTKQPCSFLMHMMTFVGVSSENNHGLIFWYHLEHLHHSQTQQRFLLPSQRGYNLSFLPCSS